MVMPRFDITGSKSIKAYTLFMHNFNYPSKEYNFAKKKCKKAKWLSGEGLQIAVKRREAKSKVPFYSWFITCFIMKGC